MVTEMKNDNKEMQIIPQKDRKWLQKDFLKKTAKEKSTNDDKETQNNQKEKQDKKEMQNKLKVMPNGFLQDTYQPYVWSEMGLDGIRILKWSLRTSWVVL